MHNVEYKRCQKLLKTLGFTGIPKLKNDDYKSYIKQGSIGVDINKAEIVLVGEFGDFLQLPVNYYALLGALMHYGYATIDQVRI